MVSVLGEPADFIIRVEADLKIAAAGALEMLFPLQLCGLTALETVLFIFSDYLSNALNYNLNDRMALAHYCILIHCNFPL
jgi:hypothetical protein